VTQPASARDERAIKDWVKRGVVHLLGSDGHSLHQRPPKISTAVDRIRRWAGPSAADRIGSINGQLVLRGVSFKPSSPAPSSRRWWALIW
jgi:protein-tyrosine phosphatase